MPTMMPAAAEGACLPIKSDLTCTGEFESGVRYQRRPGGPISLPPSLPLSFPPFRLWENSTEFLIFRCSPAARMPSPKGVRRGARCLAALYYAELDSPLFLRCIRIDTLQFVNAAPKIQPEMRKFR